MTATSRLQYKSDLLAFIGPRLHPKFKRFTYQPLTTTGAGSTTTLVDIALARGTGAAQDFNACQVEMVEAISGGVASGVIADGPKAGVSDGGFAASTGTLTFVPAMSEATVTAQDYLFYPPTMSPEQANAELNKVLRATEAHFLWAMSLVPNANFDTAQWRNNTITDDWGAVLTPTTRAMANDSGTAPGTNPPYQFLGQQRLHVVSDAVSEGVKSDPFPVVPGESLLVSVLVNCALGSLKVHLWDNVNGVSIYSVTVTGDASALSGSAGPVEVRFTALVPATCTMASIRFLSVAADSEWYVLPPVTVLPISGRAIPFALPQWLTSEEKIMGAFVYPQPYQYGTSTDLYVPFSRSLEEIALPASLRLDQGTFPLIMESFGPTRGPIFLQLFAPFPELSTNAAYSNCDREYVKWKAIANILREHGDDEWKACDKSAMRRAAALGYGKHDARMRESRTVLV